jgi:pimeloyl-ACP methyl ester carboxylesterase
MQKHDQDKDHYDHSITVKTGFAPVNGSELSYEVAGEGLPVAFLSGRNFFDQRIWDDQFLTFARNYKAIRYDQRAYGQSLGSTQPYTLEDDLADLLDELKIKKTVLLDLGSSTALDFIHKYPERVSALILVSTEISPYHSFEEAMENLPRTMERYQSLGEAIQQGDWAHATDEAMSLLTAPSFTTSARYQQVRNIVSENVQTTLRRSHAQSIDQQSFALRRQWLAEITVPTLVLIGDDAAPEIRTSVEEIVRNIPHVQQHVLADARYLLNCEQPEAFNRSVLEFLQTIPS